MNIFEGAAERLRSRFSSYVLAFLVTSALLIATWPQSLLAYQEEQAPAGTPAPYTQQTPEQLQQLVAPIALYPDSLVAQILAASTFPDQIVLADRWVQANPDLKGSALGQAVNQQPWDPSVKALTAFPSVLGNMDKNLSWTSFLGDAYYNQQQDVMNAVQVMRQRAQATGNLQTTPEQTVQTQDSAIAIQPADPDIVYVPAYNPWLVYGAPIVAWPGWYPYPGIWFSGPYLTFGIGFGIGFFGGFGWGWGHWGFDWYHRYPIYNRERYYSRSSTFYNRSNYYRAGGERGVEANVQRGMNVNRGATPERGNAERANAERANTEHRGGIYNNPGAVTHPFSENAGAARGYAEPHGESGVHSGALSNYDHGGQARSYSSRGSASLGGGSAGGAHGGGGGSHGGGGKPR